MNHFSKLGLALRLTCAASIYAVSATAAAVTPAPTLYGPSAYASVADSPFNGLTFEYKHLDDFESAIRAPGYASSSGGSILGAGSSTDSVDADDGSVDGSGNGGKSWFSAASTSTFSFTFDAVVLGRLPTHVGLVWTDVGTVIPGSLGITEVSFSAFDSGGALLATILAPSLGDGGVGGGTAEDRFFGIASLDGIARVEMTVSNSMDWEADHLQFGAIAAVPEPEQWLLMALSMGAVAAAVRRRRIGGTAA